MRGLIWRLDAESDLGDSYKGQSLAVQTLFDLCKNENASGALAEFIKSQPGIDLNTRDFKGMCPIHYASKGGFHDAIEVLLSSAADGTNPPHYFHTFPLKKILIPLLPTSQRQRQK